MSDQAQPRMVLTTVGSQEVASRIAHRLVTDHLAACVQVEGPIESHYWWEGKLHCDPEWRCVIKTTAAARDALLQTLAEIHPYDLPQILLLEASASAAYGNWLSACTRNSPPQKASSQNEAVPNASTQQKAPAQKEA